MNKELEEAKVLLSNLKNTTNTQEYVNNFSIYDNAIETVLNHIKNSISKEVIEKNMELYKQLELGSFNKDSIQADEYRAIIQVLQELLKKK